MPMSSTADPLQTVSPVSRTPSGPVRLFKALYNPTYLAIVASVGIHGLAVASLPVVGPMISGGRQKPRGPLETNILQLTPAEAARLSSAFPVPKTTVLPPGLPSLNPNANSNTPPAFSPPPLSGDLSQSQSGRGWSSIFGGNPSSETSPAYDDSSRVASNWYTGDPDADSSGYYQDDGYGSAYADSGNAYSYSYPPYTYTPGDIVGSPPSGSSSSADTQTPKKSRAKIPITQSNDGKVSDDGSQRTTMANADGVDAPGNSSGTDRILLGATPGMRTEQSAFQDLEGNYPVLVVVEPDGSVGWRLMEDDKLAEGAIEYTFDKTRPSIPSEPGEYILIVTYGTSESETTPDEIAIVEPTVPEETPTDNSELLTLQEANPDYEMLSSEPIEVFSSEESAQAIVAFVVNADGTETLELLQSTGNPKLDERAIEEAYANREAASEQTIQTFEIQFNTPENSQPETEKPTPQQDSVPVTPKPESIPETEEIIPEMEEKIPETEEIIPEMEEKIPETEEKIPETEETIPESPSEPIPEMEDTVDSNPDRKPKLFPENTEEESTEKIPIEPSPQVNPKKPRLDRQSALPSL